MVLRPWMTAIWRVGKGRALDQGSECVVKADEQMRPGVGERPYHATGNRPVVAGVRETGAEYSECARSEVGVINGAE